MDGQARGVKTNGRTTGALDSDGRVLNIAYNQLARLRGDVNALPSVTISAAAGTRGSGRRSG